MPTARHYKWMAPLLQQIAANAAPAVADMQTHACAPPPRPSS